MLEQDAAAVAWPAAQAALAVNTGGVKLIDAAAVAWGTVGAAVPIETEAENTIDAAHVAWPVVGATTPVHFGANVQVAEAVAGPAVQAAVAAKVTGGV